MSPYKNTSHTGGGVHFLTHQDFVLTLFPNMATFAGTGGEDRCTGGLVDTVQPRQSEEKVQDGLQSHFLFLPPTDVETQGSERSRVKPILIFFKKEADP